MLSLYSKLSRLPALAALLVFSAGAQVPTGTTTITYAPAAAAAAPAGIPTLSEWGLIILAGVMAFAAFKAMRKGAAGRMFSILAFAAAGAIGTAQFAAPTRAAPGTAFSEASGGVVIWTGVGEISIQNTSGVSQKITAINYSGGATPQTPVGTPQCSVGLTLAPGATCYFRVIHLV